MSSAKPIPTRAAPEVAILLLSKMITKTDYNIDTL
jgi:hypothetical protein